MTYSSIRSSRPAFQSNFAKALGCLAIMTILAVESVPMPSLGQAGEKVSRPGEYRGYSAAVYDGWVRNSTYLTMRDGIKIALDIFRPTKDGRTVEEKLPVVWVHKRYQRASLENGEVGGLLAEGGPHMTALLAHGYVLAAADSRGTGASFGVCEGVYTETEALDSYEIIEWLASQPWSTGRIGMVGSSYEGTNQLMAAAKKPPHLKAIMPAMAMFDIYDLAYPGGIFRYDLVKTWSELTKQIDTLKTPAPVDEDAEGKLLKDALVRRPQNRSAYDIVSPLEYRDDKDPLTGRRIYRIWQPAGFVREIKQSGVAVCLICGWYDAYIRDAFLMFKNLGPRFKMIVMDCSHSPQDPSIFPEAINILTYEQLRWFDYWLKGIDNGVMNEAPIRFQTNIEATTRIWRAAGRWPLRGTEARTYFFQSGPSGGVASGNDGRLTTDSPRERTGEDHYSVDYSSTSGQRTRWDNTVGGDFEYPDMTANDVRGLTYTTPPLAEDVDVTGHPILHLWISSTAEDGDFIAFLEEIDPKGVSHYVSEGSLRASHRALGRPPYEMFGLPYHGSAKKDILPLIPSNPTELVFDLLPTSTIFNAGHRIRITIVCADKDNLGTPVVTPVPRIAVFRKARAASRLDLPVVPRGSRK